MIALAVIACLHLAVFYALSSGLVSSVISPAPSIRASFVPEPRTREAPPTTPQPSLITGHIDIQPPEIHLVSPSDPHADDALAADAHIVSAAPPHVVNRVPGGPAAGFPATDDYYPPAARRLGEQGAATVQVCVDPSGKLSTVPTLALSSGSPRLDLGAIRLASAGSGHYRAATEDGRAVSGCFPLRVRFQLSN